MLTVDDGSKNRSSARRDLVIAIIAVVAIPTMQASKKSAVDAKAIGMLRTIVTSQEQYKTRFGVYAPDLLNLSNPTLLGVTVTGSWTMADHTETLVLWTQIYNPNG